MRFLARKNKNDVRFKDHLTKDKLVFGEITAPIVYVLNQIVKKKNCSFEMMINSSAEKKRLFEK